jgi:hypothetical protein
MLMLPVLSLIFPYISLCSLIFKAEYNLSEACIYSQTVDSVDDDDDDDGNDDHVASEANLEIIIFAVFEVTTVRELVPEVLFLPGKKIVFAQYYGSVVDCIGG